MSVRRSIVWWSLGLALLAAADARPAWAWGPTGHRIVARIAENHISAETARAVDELIGPASLARVAFWADQVRSDPAYRQTTTWHYVNIDDGKTYERSAKNPRGDVVRAIRFYEGLLADRSKAPSERAVALKFLVHLVADVHQPLHVGRASDRGGNRIEVTWFGDSTNLHRVWDSQIIEAQKLSFSEYASFLDHPTPEQLRAWQASGPLEWVEESMALRPRVYAIGDGKLDFAYGDRSVPIIEERLLQAGLRLAARLDQLLVRSPRN